MEGNGNGEMFRSREADGDRERLSRKWRYFEYPEPPGTQYCQEGCGKPLLTAEELVRRRCDLCHEEARDDEDFS